MHPQVLRKPENFALFVEQALRKGITEICVTDHMPLSRSSAKDRLLPGTVRDYCKRVRELAAQYAGRVSIKCGIEIDFHPSVMGEIKEVLGAGEFDYILASSHMHIFIKDYENYTYNTFAAAALENALRAAESGLFHALAHPDMYRFAFENPVRFPLVAEAYSPHRHMALIGALLDEIASRGMYLEVNPHLAEGKGDLAYCYPAQEIATLALERGVKFSYGSDAHAPESVGALLDELEAHPIYGQALAAWEA